jgi:hypothetical protein
MEPVATVNSRFAVCEAVAVLVNKTARQRSSLLVLTISLVPFSASLQRKTSLLRLACSSLLNRFPIALVAWESRSLRLSGASHYITTALMYCSKRGFLDIQDIRSKLVSNEGTM